MALTAAHMKALREPFPPEHVGKLPKPKKGVENIGHCNVCGGRHKDPGCFHVDYVGHGHVTDRVLSVDPNYEFETVKDVNGRPVTREGGREGVEVLYRMSIHGTSREEWGDAANMKETASDGFTRCAMRFGVGLDLWQKETPVMDSGERPLAARKTPAKTKPRASHIRMFEAAKDAGVDDDLRRRITRMFTGASSSKELSDEEADKVTKQLAWFEAHRASSLAELRRWEEANP